MNARFRLTVCLLAIALLWPLAQARAIFVLRKGENEPLLGHLVSENAKQLVIRVERGDTEQNVSVPRSDIEELIYTTDPARLAALSPSQPRAYREYAEELSEMQADPEARDTARRLFVIAANLDPSGVGRSALLGLANLARTPQEAAACRAAAYLCDPLHDRALLQPWQAAKLEPAAATDAHDELLRALVFARHEDFAAARRVVESPKGKAQYAQIESIFSRKEFLAACGTGKLTEDQLRRLLSAELALLRRDSGDLPPPETSTADWARALRTKEGLAPVPALQLELLTEFDPRASIYREGKWQRP
jgi:hypothetical protein